jgi:hypothetical protein
LALLDYDLAEDIAISYLDESEQYDVLLEEKSVSLQERKKRIENALSTNGGGNRGLTLTWSLHFLILYLDPRDCIFSLQAACLERTSENTPGLSCVCLH